MDVSFWITNWVCPGSFRDIGMIQLTLGFLGCGFKFFGSVSPEQFNFRSLLLLLIFFSLCLSVFTHTCFWTVFAFQLEFPPITSASERTRCGICFLSPGGWSRMGAHCVISSCSNRFFAVIREECFEVGVPTCFGIRTFVFLPGYFESFGVLEDI